MSSPGNLETNWTEIFNGGTLTTTLSTLSAGTFQPNFSKLWFPVGTTSTGIIFSKFTDFSTTAPIILTTAGTNTCSFFNCNFICNGSTNAISIGTGTGVSLYHCFLSSSATYPITGTGTLIFTELEFNSIGAIDPSLTISNAAAHTWVSAGGVGSAGQVYTSNGASSPPTFQTASGGVVVQQIRATKSTAQTITNNIGAITTTPTTSTGSSVVQVSITPTNAAHILVIEAVLVATSAGNYFGAYIIQNAAGNSIATSWTYGAAANVPNHTTILAYITAGGTSAITFDLYGMTVGANTYVNANTSATQLSGGTATSTLTVTEYTS